MEQFDFLLCETIDNLDDYEIKGELTLWYSDGFVRVTEAEFALLVEKYAELQKERDQLIETIEAFKSRLTDLMEDF